MGSRITSYDPIICADVWVGTWECGVVCTEMVLDHNVALQDSNVALQDMSVTLQDIFGNIKNLDGELVILKLVFLS